MTGITHKQAQRYMRADLDGLLTAAQSRDLIAHLDECEACRLESESLSSLTTRLQSGFHSRWDTQHGPSTHVMANIKSQTRRIIMSKRIDFAFNILGGAATLLVLFFVITSVISQFQKKSTPANGAQATNGTNSVSEEVFSIATNKFNGEWIAFITAVDQPLTSENLKTDVFMIRPDGSGLVNLTNSPAEYYYLQWSPNGNNLVVLQEHNDTINIIRISQTGGSEVIAGPITDHDHYGYSWSPNSDKIIFADSSNGNYDIYTIYADGRNDPQLTQLTNNPGQDVGFVWSPDGSQIAFQRLDGEKLSVYIMNADGSDQHEVAHGSGKVNLRWSQDGRSIYASSTKNNWLECEACVAKPAIYHIDLDGQSVRQIYAEQDASKILFWYLYDTPQSTLYFMRINPPVFVEFWGTWMKSDGNSVRELGEMDPHQTCKTTTGNSLNEHISPNERFSIISNYCAGGFDLYLADRETSDPEKKLVHLLRLPSDTFGQGGNNDTLPILWSPDGRWLIYDNGQAAMYLLNIERVMQDPTTEPALLFQSGIYSVFEAAWQPALENNIVDQEPTQTDNRLLAFASEKDGNSEIYTVRADGSDLTNITNNPALDMHPFWSPDGKRIAFQSDRNGGYYSQIFLMDADGSNIVQLTTDKGDHFLPFNADGKADPWSPDGSKLVFLRRGLSEAEWILQAIDIHSGNTTSFVTGRISFNGISWSPNGKYIGFILNDPQNTELDKFVSQIHAVSADGANVVNINSLLPTDEDQGWLYTYDWSSDGESISIITSNMPSEGDYSFGSDSESPYYWKVYEASLEFRTLTVLATTRTPIGGWWQGSYFLKNFREPTITWVSSDGKITQANPTKDCKRIYNENTGGYTDGVFVFDQSPDGNGVVGAYCPNGDMTLFLVNPQGTIFKTLLNLPAFAPSNADGYFGWAPVEFAWSQDNKFIAFNIVLNNKIDMYIVNVTESAKDPSLPPVRVPVGYSQLNLIPAWQPIP